MTFSQVECRFGSFSLYYSAWLNILFLILHGKILNTHIWMSECSGWLVHGSDAGEGSAPQVLVQQSFAFQWDFSQIEKRTEEGENYDQLCIYINREMLLIVNTPNKLKLDEWDMMMRGWWWWCSQRSLVIISVRLLQAYLLINQFYFKCSFGYISAVGWLSTIGYYRII